MDIESLRKAARKTGVPEKMIHIGDTPIYDERFNLYKRPDGKWEVFYGEHGCKSNLREYETEEAAVQGFLEFLKGDRTKRITDYFPLLARLRRMKADRKKTDG